MEPTRNARVGRSQRRTFYNFTRRYGDRITLRKVLLNDLDYETGVRDRTYTSQVVRNAVHVPPLSERNVTYTAAMMQAMRQFAWQGAGVDLQESQFLIFEGDIKSWGELDSTQQIQHRGKTYEVVRVQHYDGGAVVWTKVAIQDET